ncbi:MAG: peptidase T [Synergistaceae bacterium]|nr:peptidase T [Synergistaceae bacterium]
MYSTLEHFLKYVTYDTQSKEDAGTVPSTPGQWDLAREMERELRDRGLKDVTISDHAYVTATLPANTDKAGKVPAIGFIAHMDTATEASGKDVKARIVENYDGGDVTLNEKLNVVLSPKDFPFMKNYVGQDLVVTDGTTLLGADNKAGMAEIMGAVDWLLEHPEFEHGPVKLAFTPDEEVSELASGLDIEKFGADFAYTLDGGPIGEICYENFNAASAVISIEGRAVHPGTAKGLMLNAVMLGHELLSLLPASETPATTEKYEGYFHCLSFEGETEKATLRFIIRDHDREKFEARKKFMEKCVKWLNDKYGENRFKLEMKDQYYNMAEKLQGHMDIVDTAVEAMKALDITPFFIPMRGGTDGAALSWRGLITPNLFTGGHNYHGRFEFIPVQVMEKATSMVLKILELYAKAAK